MSDVAVRMPEVMRLLEDSQEPVMLVLRAARGRPVRLAITGIAGSGKSTLLNALTSVLAKAYCHVVDAGEGFGDKGQRTLAPRLIRLLDHALDEVPNEAADFEVSVWDLVGHRSAQELAVALSGRMRSGERFPEAIDMVAMSELLQRPVKVRDAVNCGIVLVPAVTLHTERHAPSYVVDAMNVARANKANTDDVHVLPLILVITKVDEWEGVYGHDRSVLLERGGVMGPLLQKAAEWGFPGTMVLTMGYLDSGTIDYSDAHDPCVAVLKYLLVLAARTGRLFQQDL